MSNSDPEERFSSHSSFHAGLRRGLHQALIPPPELLQTRDNFPLFEDVFAEKDCSSSSSSFNLSIGTRAALNCHLRHVAEVGIDGDEHIADNASTRQLTPQRAINSSQDEQWERMINGDLSSVDSSFLNETLSSIPSADIINNSLNDSSDTNSIYSRVNTCLLTPPRNYNAKIQGVTVRGQDEQDSEASRAGSSMIRLGRGQDFETDFDGESTFSPPSSDIDTSRTSTLDISRISHDGSDMIHQEGPDAFFEEQRIPLCKKTINSTESPIHSCSSTTLSLRADQFCSRGRSPHLLPFDGNDITATNQKAFDANLDVMSLSPLSYTRSVDLAKREKSNQYSLPLAGHGVDQNVYTVPSSFLLGSTPQTSDIRQMHFSLSTPESDMSAISNHLISENQTSSTCSSSPLTSQLAHDDRRRFRTVVPHRVFMDNPGDFPEYNDSF
jgi:hypothetical protein